MTGLAKVGDRIEHGQPIPGNIALLRDVEQDLWQRQPDGYHCTTDGTSWALQPDGTGRNLYGDAGRGRMPGNWFPMTVVEVDPEPQPAWTGFVHVFMPGSDDCCNALLMTGSPRLPGKVRCGHVEEAPIHLQPAEPDVVHYFISEFGPSGATLCGIGIEEDGDLSTTAEAGKATCRECRDAADEGPADDLRALLLPIWQGYATSPDKPGNAELARWVGLLIEHGDRDRRALKEAYRAADPSQPVALRLPEVPEGTVALVDREQRRWTPARIGAQWELLSPDGDELLNWRTLGNLLGDFGPLTVEFAPPREPRTWPKIESLPPGVAAVEVEGAGVWEKACGPGAEDLLRQQGSGMLATLGTLREMGDVTEVLS